jgi:hypothetical protein
MSDLISLKYLSFIMKRYRLRFSLQQSNDIKRLNSLAKTASCLQPKKQGQYELNQLFVFLLYDSY